MSFYDIKRISYDRLMNRVALDKPYANSGNAYPIGDRKYSDRHFRHEADDTFTIWYADRMIIDNKYGRTNDKQGALTQHGDYYDKRMLGIVRPDNSFEFTGQSGQGENMMLSRGLAAYVHHDKSRGGLLYEYGKLMHPVFKGLRIDCETGMALTEYEAFLPKLKHKEAKEVMAQYAEFMTLFGTMIKAMDDKGVWEVYVDMFVHEAQGKEDLWRSMNMSTVKRLIAEKKYVDAGCLFTMLSKLSHMRWRTEWVMSDTDGTGKVTRHQLPHAFADRAISDVQVNFRKMILKQHPEVFKLHPLERGAVLPTSQWGLLIEVDGKPVERL